MTDAQIHSISYKPFDILPFSIFLFYGHKAPAQSNDIDYCPSCMLVHHNPERLFDRQLGLPMQTCKTRQRNSDCWKDSPSISSMRSRV